MYLTKKLKMNYFNKLIIVIISTIVFNNLNAQDLKQKDSLTTKNKENTKFQYKKLIIPATLMTYGIIGIESDALKAVNYEINEEVLENIDEKFTIDDFSQYAPAAAVYALNLSGIKGKNNLRDRSIVLATSYLLMGSSVYALKKITKVERPDHSGFNSFPSGHTATSFAGAEFVWQEYKDVSIWYGISGYLVATGTGFFRIYNNKHWLTDVAMGAGIGILSTKIAYWIFPFIDNHIFKSEKNSSTAMLAPFYNGKQLGIGMVISIN
jgi:membrane-associated phospholipid phosphatase